METLILGAIVFALCFIGRLLMYVIGKRKKKKRGGISTDKQNLINRFKLVKEKVDKKTFSNLLSYTYKNWFSLLRVS